ncbi:MAG: carboxymuconolactone decarboxylase family protein [Geminicoccales bacterium]
MPPSPRLADVFKTFPDQVLPLLAYHDALLRAEGPIEVGDRELIAAYVSGLNACNFCFEGHKVFARALGIPDGVIDALMTDIDSAPVDDKLKPILSYVKKLNELPTRLGQADAKAVYDAGWSERALYDAIQIAALFNMMNRIVEGTGVSVVGSSNAPNESELEKLRKHSYSGFARTLGLTESGQS